MSLESLINNFLPLSLPALCASRGWPGARHGQQVFPCCPQLHPSASSTSSILLGSEEALTRIMGATGRPLAEGVAAPADLGMVLYLGQLEQMSWYLVVNRETKLLLEEPLQG